MRRLCGWDSATQVPGESTCSRAFAEFAATGLPAQVHEALVRKTQQDRTIDYIARDSTAIEARERLPGDNDKTARAKPAAKHPRYRTARGYHQRAVKEARTAVPRLRNAVVGSNANSI